MLLELMFIRRLFQGPTPEVAFLYNVCLRVSALGGALLAVDADVIVVAGFPVVPWVQFARTSDMSGIILRIFRF